MADLIERFHALAEETGAYIVPACGFDSVPSDLTSWLAESRVREMCAAFKPHAAWRGAGGGPADSLARAAPVLRGAAA